MIENDVYQNEFFNNDYGIYLSHAWYNHFFENNIIDNDHIKGESGSVLIYSCSDNKIHNNNFINNGKGIYFLLCKSNNWDGNYWDKPRIFPKLIRGKTMGLLILLWPWFNIDWHPAKEPYDL